MSKCALCGKKIKPTKKGVFVAPKTGWYDFSITFDEKKETKTVLAHHKCSQPPSREKEKS